MKFVLFYLIKFYKSYLSVLLPRSCRYYPTCSQYALWKLRYSGSLDSIFSIILRILRCNQLFKGGIDYPVARIKFRSQSIFFKSEVTKLNFIFVPFKKDKFYIIKVFY